MCHLCLFLSPFSALLPPGKAFSPIYQSGGTHLRRVSARVSDSFRLSGLLHRKVHTGAKKTHDMNTVTLYGFEIFGLKIGNSY